MFFTDILRQYKFPKFANEKFCTEALVWNRIAKDGWLFRFFNENIYYTKYLNDGLTKKYQVLMEQNPCQSYIFFKEYYKNNIYMTYKIKILYFLNLIYFAKKSNGEDNVIKEFNLNKIFIRIVYYMARLYRLLKY